MMEAGFANTAGETLRAFPQGCARHNPLVSAALTNLAGMDSARFEKMAAATRRRVYHHAYRLLGNATDAEDVTQETYVRAWQHFDRFDARRAIEPWLLRIVTNLTIDLRRRQKCVPMLSLNASLHEAGPPLWHDLTAPDSDPENIVLATLQDEGIARAMAGLSAEYQQMLHLTTREGLTYEEIAKRLQCPVGTVRSRVHRARTRLRENLQRNADEGHHHSSR